MADLNRGDTYDLILKDNGLKKKHLIILLNEKVNQIKALKNTLEKMKTVDFKKIELQQDILTEEIKGIKEELLSTDSNITFTDEII
jgi:hypothetical protein